jgi:hypothetical protein
MTIRRQYFVVITCSYNLHPGHGHEFKAVLPHSCSVHVPAILPLIGSTQKRFVAQIERLLQHALIRAFESQGTSADGEPSLL